MPSAVIFDLDGTLVDTIEDIALAVNGSLAARGLPCHDLAAYRLMVGNGFSSLVRLALPEDKRRAELVEELRAEASAAYAAHLLDNSLPYPGVPELLGALVQRGIPRSVLSNKPEAHVIMMVKALFPDAGFAFVRGEGPYFPRKPEPDHALHIARGLGIDAREIVYLGDSDVDMRTARNAGMVAVGAAWGFRGRAELLTAGAELVIDSPLELLALFEKTR
jgi:phosphoglycolate phosphatase